MRKIPSVMLISLVFFWVPFLACSQPRDGSQSVSAQPGTLIYLDTSKSMRGFFRSVSEGSGTIIQRFLREDLLQALSERKGDPFFLSKFGTLTGKKEAINSLRRYSFFQSRKEIEDFYCETETNLVRVFDKKMSHGYAMAVIVTDGLQSEETVSNQSPEPHEGFDVGKLVNQLKELMADGANIWLIGILSQFNGYVYPEKLDPQGYRSAFEYSGPRPVYIWVIAAKDKQDEGRKLTELFLEKLLQLSDSRSKVKAIELSSPQMPPQVSWDPDFSRLKGLLPYAVTDKAKYRFKLVRKDVVDQIPLQVKLQTIQSIIDPLVKDWQIRLELGTRDQQWITIEEEDGDYNLNIDCSKIRSRKVSADVNAVLTPTGYMENPWWKEWNTNHDNDSNRKREARKTLYLEKVIREVAGPLLKPHLRKMFSLEIGK